MLVCCSEEADPSCSASTLSNEEYASLLDAAMRLPDRQVQLLIWYFHTMWSDVSCVWICITANRLSRKTYVKIHRFLRDSIGTQQTLCDSQRR